jgi:2'-5' RNA ligase
VGIRGNWRGALRSAAALVTRRRTADSTVILPVLAVTEALAAVLDQKNFADNPDLPPHVTILYPFLPVPALDAPAESAIGELLADFKPFRFSLTAVGRFPGVLYLAPSPPEPFLALTDAFVRRWPDFRPYRGAYAEVVPHLTIATGDERPGLAARLEGILPLEANADELWLLTQGADHRWTMRRRFPLGVEPT